MGFGVWGQNAYSGENNEEYQPKKNLQEQQRFEERNVEFSRQCSPVSSTPEKLRWYKDREPEGEEHNISVVHNEASSLSGFFPLDESFNMQPDDADVADIGGETHNQDDATTQPRGNPKVETRRVERRFFYLVDYGSIKEIKVHENKSGLRLASTRCWDHVNANKCASKFSDSMRKEFMPSIGKCRTTNNKHGYLDR